MGAKGGPKTGGRKRGSTNKATVQEAEARQAVARADGQRLGIEIMRECMNRFSNLAAKYQPKLPDGNTNPEYDEKKYVTYLAKAGEFGDKLAPYETPRLATTALAPHDPTETKSIHVKLEFV